MDGVRELTLIAKPAATILDELPAEELKAIKSKMESLESTLSKMKAEANTAKQAIETLKKKGGGKPSAEELDERRKKVKCHNCGKMGHYQSECPELKNKEEDEG